MTTTIKNLTLDRVEVTSNSVSTQRNVAPLSVDGNLYSNGDLIVQGNITAKIIHGDGSGIFDTDKWNPYYNDIYYTNGSVSVGTSSLLQRLNVNGTVHVSDYVVSSQYRSKTDNIEFISDDKIQMTIDVNTGYVGIGTFNPEAPLHVAGNMTIRGDLVVYNNITVFGNTTIIDTENLLINNSYLIVSNNNVKNLIQDGGFIIERGDENNVGMIWDDTKLEFGFVNTTSDGTISEGSLSGSVSHVNLRIDALDATELVSVLELIGNGSQLSNIAQVYYRVFNVTITGSGYIIDGILKKELDLIQGKTYKFNLLNLVGSDPFTISTSVEGGSINVVYVDGVIGNGNSQDTVDKFLIFHVGVNTPYNLYYQSDSTSFMGARINIVSESIYDTDRNTEIYMSTSATNATVHFVANSVDCLTMSQDGHIGVLTYPTEQLSVDGSVAINGSLIVGINNTQCLGSDDMRFSDVYLGRIVTSGDRIELDDELIFNKNIDKNTTLSVDQLYTDVIYTNESYIREVGNDFYDLNKWKGYQDIYFMKENVGIGTNNPTSKIHVIGNMTSEGRIETPEVTVHGINLYPLTQSIWTQATNIDDIYLTDGRVAINKKDPVHELDINGYINSSFYLGDASFLENVNSDKWWGDPYNILEVTDGNATVVNRTVDLFYNSGFVGINTNTPREKLEIDGIMMISDTNMDMNGTIRMTNVLTGPNYNNLVAWWYFNENDGLTTEDVSLSNNTATLIDTSWVSGIIGDYAVSFNGITSYINGTNNINIFNSSFSISFWFKRANFGTFETVISQGLSNPDQLNISFEVDSTLSVTFQTSVIISNTVFNDTLWHMCVITYELSSNNRVLYIDDEIDNRDLAGGCYMGYGELNIGRSVVGSDYFIGSIDDVRIYNEVISADDISLLYDIINYQDIQGYIDNRWVSMTQNYKIQSYWNKSYRTIISGFDASKDGITITLGDSVTEVWGIDVVGNYIVFESLKTLMLIVNRVSDTEIEVETGLLPDFVITQPYSIREYYFDDIAFRSKNNPTLIGIGTNNPNHTLTVVGNISITGNLSINDNFLMANISELNILSGLITNTSELNILDGLVATQHELRYLTDVKFGQAVPEHVLISDINNNINLGNGNLKVDSLIVNGNLSILTNTSTINTQSLVINSSILFIGHDQNSNSDGGIFIERNSNQNVSMLWDEDTDKFNLVYTSGIIGTDVLIDSHARLHLNDLQSDANVSASYYIGNGSDLKNVKVGYMNEFFININDTSSNFFVDEDENKRLTLVKGQTYKFNISNVSSGHIFTISTSPYGGDVSENFTNGIIDIGSALIFEVPYNFVGDLYYQCENHQHEGGKLDITNTVLVNSNNSVSVVLDDTINVITNVNKSFIIDQSGRILINTTSTDHLLNIGGNLSISGNIYPPTDGTYDLGSFDMVWDKAYINDLFLNGSSLYVDNKLILSYVNDEYVLNVTEIFASTLNTSSIFVTENNISLNLNKWNGTENIYFIKGNVGIGTNEPSTQLHIIGNTTINGSLYCNTASIYGFDIVPEPIQIWNAISGDDINFTGNVGINTSTPYYNLDVVGIINASHYIGDGSLLSGIELDKWLGPSYNYLDGTTVVNRSTNIYYQNYVGIGIEPRDTLDVNGAIVIDTTDYGIDGTIRYAKSFEDPCFYKLKSWWLMTETNSTIIEDISINDNNATLVNMDNNNWITGIIGDYALDFNGTTNYVDCGDIDISLRSFSLSVWLKRNTIGVNSTILSQGVESLNNNLNIEFNINNTLTFGFYGNDLITTSTFTNTITWDYYVFTYDKLTNIRSVYVNSVLDNTDVSTELYIGTGNIFIGKSVVNDGYFAGCIDDVRIYEKVLLQVDIDYLYNIDDKFDFQGYVDNKWLSLSIKDESEPLLWIINETTNSIYYNPTTEVDNFGRIAIGKTTPTSILDINGSLNITDGLILNNILLTANITELNSLTGLTANSTEINILSGLTATTNDINLLVNITNGIASPNKLLISDANNSINMCNGSLIINNLVVTGDITVAGDLTRLNSQNLVVNDSLVLLGYNQDNPVYDSGFIIERGIEDDVGIIWDNSHNEFAFITTNNNGITNNVSINNYTKLHVHNLMINGTLDANNYIGNGALLSDIDTFKWKNDNGNINYILGNVGLNNVDPKYKLDINGSLYINTSEDIDIDVNGISQFYINITTNNIGISNNDPQYKLDVLGSSNIDNSLLVNSINNNYLLNSQNDLDNSTFSSSLHIKSETSSLLYVNSSTHYTGINTNTPVSALDVAGSMAISDQISIGSNIINGDALYVIGTVNSTNIIGNASGLTGIVWSRNVDNSIYRLETNNIGIGINNSSVGLEVSGDITAEYFVGNGTGITDILWGSNENGLYLLDSNIGIGTNNPSEEVTVIGTVNAISYIGDGSGLTGTKIWNNNTYNLSYNRGNVGINVLLPVFDLDINGSVLINTDSIDNIFEIESTINDNKISHIVVNSTNGYIGFNTPYPEYNLDITGSTNINNSLSINTLTNTNILNVHTYNDTDTTSSTLHIQTRKLGSLHSQLYINSSTNYIGINTNIPDNTIVVNGSVSISNTVSIGTNPIFTADDALNVQGIVNCTVLLGNGSGLTGVEWNIKPDGSMYRLNTNNIGIGTSMPVELLDINGNIRSSYFAGNGSSLTDIMWSKVGNDIHYLHGNVGISNINPNQSLVVCGTITATSFIGNGALLLGGSQWIVNESDVSYLFGNVGMNVDVANVILDINGSTLIIADSIDDRVLNIVDTNLGIEVGTYFEINSSSHAIGINRANAEYTLDVSGTCHIGHSVVIGNSTDTQSVLYVLNDVNTTSYSKTLDIHHNGSSKFSINSITGNVGINIGNQDVSASYKLDVNGSCIISNKMSINNVITDDTLYVNGIVNATNYIANGSQLLGLNWKHVDNNLERIETNNVGIGTDNPSTLLDVIGDINAVNFIGNGASLTDIGWINSSYGLHYMLGNVGIGTSTPQYALDVLGIVKADYLIGNGELLTNITSTIWTQEADYDISYIYGKVGINTNTPNTILDIHNRVLLDIEGNFIYNGDNALNIATNDGTTVTSLFTINSTNSRVGVQTVIPSYELDITGNMSANTQFVLGSSSVSTKLLDIVVDQADVSSSLLFKSKTGTDMHTQLHIQSGDGYIGINNEIASYRLDVNGTVVISNKTIINSAPSVNELNIIGTVNATILTGNVSLGTGLSSWIENPDGIHIIESKNIGINTSSASDVLEVCGTVSATEFVGDGSNLTDIGIWSNVVGDINYMGGNVGIRTTNALYKLDICGNMKSTTYIGNGSQITNTSVWKEYNDKISYIKGNVGIGTLSIIDKQLTIDGALLIKGNINIPTSINDKVFRIDNRVLGTTTHPVSTFNIGTLSKIVDLTSTIVTDDNRIFFAGGSTRLDARTNFVDIYDYKQNAWSHTTLSSERVIEKPLYTADKIYYINGIDNSSVRSNQVDIYDTNINQWLYTTTSVGRSGFSASVIGNLLLVAGGTSDGINYLNKIDILDTNTNIWSETTLKVARCNHTMITLDDKLYIAGGEIGSSTVTNSIEVYDFTNDLWTEPHTLSKARNHLASGSNYPFAVFTGGDITNGVTHNIDLYNAKANVWTRSTISHSGIRNNGVMNFKNKILIGGGTDGTNFYNKIDIFDTKTFTWTQSTLSRTGQFLSTSSLDIDNKYYSIFAGGRDGSVDYNTIELLEFTDAYTNKSPLFNITGSNGFIGIGTDTPTSLLNVVGNISIQNGNMIVNSTTMSVPDYVFEPDYPLMSLNNLKTFVTENKHLPNIQNQLTVRQNGLRLGSLQMNILEKIEEVTLYKIDQYQQYNNITQFNTDCIQRIDALELRNLEINKMIDDLL